MQFMFWKIMWTWLFYMEITSLTVQCTIQNSKLFWKIYNAEKIYTYNKKQTNFTLSTNLFDVIYGGHIVFFISYHVRHVTFLKTLFQDFRHNYKVFFRTQHINLIFQKTNLKFKKKKEKFSDQYYSLFINSVQRPNSIQNINIVVV